MMTILKYDKIPVENEVDLMTVRHKVRAQTKDVGLNLVDQTKLVTASSELARNMLNYAKGGVVYLEQIQRDEREGIRVTFEDQGPGIPDLDQAMQDGYSSIGGLGLGLPGAKRLVNEFAVVSEVGKGTTVTIIKWK